MENDFQNCGNLVVNSVGIAKIRSKLHAGQSAGSVGDRCWWSHCSLLLSDVTRHQVS